MRGCRIRDKSRDVMKIWGTRRVIGHYIVAGKGHTWHEHRCVCGGGGGSLVQGNEEDLGGCGGGGAERYGNLHKCLGFRLSVLRFRGTI